MKEYQKTLKFLLIVILTLYAGWRLFGVYQNEQERIRREERSDELA